MQPRVFQDCPDPHRSQFFYTIEIPMTNGRRIGCLNWACNTFDGVYAALDAFLVVPWLFLGDCSQRLALRVCGSLCKLKRPPRGTVCVRARWQRENAFWLLFRVHRGFGRYEWCSRRFGVQGVLRACGSAYKLKCRPATVRVRTVVATCGPGDIRTANSASLFLCVV